MNKKLTLKENMLWSSAGSMINMICQWLVTVLIIRLSFGNYEIAGVYTLAMSVYAIFSHIAHYRMYVYQVTDLKEENTIGEYLAFRILTCIVGLVFCAIYALLTCDLNAFVPIILFGVYKSIVYVVDVLHAQDQKNERMDYIGKSLAMQGVLALLIFSIVFYFAQNLSLALISMSFVIVIVGIAYDFPRTSQFGKIRISISFNKALYLLKHCSLIVVGYMATSCSPSIPRQYLAYKLGENMLGVYGTVSAPVAVIQMGASYIYNPLMGYFAQHFENKEFDDFFILLLKTSAAILGVGFICTVILILACNPLLVFLFGSSIAEYTYIMPLLAISSIITAYSGYLNDLLTTCRLFKATVVCGLIALLGSGLTTPIMLSLYELNGVTVSIITGSLLSSLYVFLYLCFSIRKLKTSR